MNCPIIKLFHTYVTATVICVKKTEKLFKQRVWHSCYVQNSFIYYYYMLDINIKFHLFLYFHQQQTNHNFCK